MADRINEHKLSRYVYLRDGAIVVETMLKKLMGDETRRLVSCCEDNIFDTEDGECINYRAALKDFYEAENG